MLCGPLGVDFIAKTDSECLLQAEKSPYWHKCHVVYRRITRVLAAIYHALCNNFWLYTKKKSHSITIKKGGEPPINPIYLTKPFPVRFLVYTNMLFYL